MIEEMEGKRKEVCECIYMSEHSSRTHYIELDRSNSIP